VKKLRCLVSIPGDTMYLREQTAAAQATAARLGMELEVVSAEMDAVAQGQQVLKSVQARNGLQPDAILLEPVSAAGLPRVAEAAVAAGIAWIVSNAKVDYISALRAKTKAPVFLVSRSYRDRAHSGPTDSRNATQRWNGSILARAGHELDCFTTV